MYKNGDLVLNIENGVLFRLNDTASILNDVTCIHRARYRLANQNELVWWDLRIININQLNVNLQDIDNQEFI